jgi:eukaryotic-like serine/threonine-protein kinase
MPDVTQISHSSPAADAGDGDPLPDSAGGDRYTVLCELARGGLGRVLAASDDLLGRDVALKHVLAPSPEAHARFEREARLTARLQHAGVVPVYDAGRLPNGEPFYVMKKVEGRSLAELIAAAARFEDRLGLLPRVQAVIETVAYAHSCGVIHRDLKPSNVIVSDYGETVVVDWGLAKDLAEAEDVAPVPIEAPEATGNAPAALTQIGRVLGTPEFMPPEQAEGRPVDERADVYALGAILYNVLTGEQPYAHTTSGALEKVRRAAPPPVRARVPGVPDDLAAIVEKAMARSPSSRYAAAGELAQDLRRFLDGQLVHAHRYPASALALRWLRRHRAPVLVAVVLLAALIASAVAGVRGILAERNAALEARNTAVQARRTVEARENALVLLQAQRSLGEEPTAALAWLKRFRPSSDQAWLGAAVAEEAVALGVARHIFPFSPPAQTVAVSPVQPLMAAGQSDGTLSVYDVDSGRRTRVGSHGGAVTDVAFSPQRGLLAAGDSHGEIRIWSTDGQQRAQLRLEGGAVSRLLYSPDGRTLAVVSDRSDVTMIDTSGPRPTVQLAFPIGGRSSGLVFCPVSATLVLTTTAGKVLVLDRDARQPRALRDTHPDARLLCLTDGARFVSAGVDGIVKLWNVRGGAPRLLGRHEDWVTSIAASPDGRLVATGSGDDTIHLMSTGGGPTRVLRGHGDTVRGLTFSAGGEHLASVSYDSSVRIWDVASGETLREFRAPTRLGATRLQFTSDGRQLVASGLHEARVWPADGLPANVKAAHGSVVADLGWSPDSRLLASGSRDQTVRTWDIHTGATWTSALLGDWILMVRFRDARSLIVGTRHKGTELVELGTGRRRQLTAPDSVHEQSFVGPERFAYPEAGPGGTMVVRRLDSAQKVTLAGLTPQPINDLSFTRDGQRVVVATEDGLVGTWSTATGQVLARHQVGESVLEVAVAPDGNRAALFTAHNRLLRWDLDRDQLVEVPTDHVRGERLFFRRDGRTLIYMAWDGTLRIVDAVSFASQVLHGHRVRIIEMVHSQSQPNLVATSDFNGFFRLWNLDTGQSAVLHARTGTIENMAFSPDGKYLATSGEDARIRLWDLTTLPLGQLRPKPQSWLADRTTAVVDERQGLHTP